MGFRFYRQYPYHVISGMHSGFCALYIVKCGMPAILNLYMSL